MSEAETMWDRLKETNAGMLGLQEDRRLVPMSHYPDPSAKCLWFITARGTDLVQEIQSGPKTAEYVIASGSDGLYARLSGDLRLENNQQKLDEIWNFVASSWFEDGKRDEDIRLLKFSLINAEVWATSKSSVAFLYEIAKAKVTGGKPDMGEHFELEF